MNKFIIDGNLTRDAEIATTSSGKTLCSFSIANNDHYAKSVKTQYFDVKIWGELGENLSKYLKKGVGVLVCGKIKIDSYTAKDGSKRQLIYLEANELQFMNNHKKESNSKSRPTLEKCEESDGLPF